MRYTWMLPMFVGVAFAQDPVQSDGKSEAEWEAEIAAEVAKLPFAEVERPWKEHAYPGFVESIDALVGPGAHDCGYYDTIERRQTPEFHKFVRQCVEAAIASGNPFKFGHESTGVDAHTWVVLARSPSGELWYIHVSNGALYGRGIGQLNSVCKSFRFFSDIRTIEEGCVEKSRGPLLPK
jgi:hypothetical protein